jgi:hypothetical protein
MGLASNLSEGPDRKYLETSKRRGEDSPPQDPMSVVRDYSSGASAIRASALSILVRRKVIPIRKLRELHPMGRHGAFSFFEAKIFADLWKTSWHWRVDRDFRCHY